MGYIKVSFPEILVQIAVCLILYHTVQDTFAFTSETLLPGQLLVYMSTSPIY